MPLLIDERCYDVMMCGPWGSLLSTAGMAKETGLYDPGTGKNQAFSWYDAMEYLNSYGHDPAHVRVLMSPATSLGKHGFSVLFQWRRHGQWVTEMNGGLVFREGEGWSVHT